LRRIRISRLYLSRTFRFERKEQPEVVDPQKNVPRGVGLSGLKENGYRINFSPNVKLEVKKNRRGDEETTRVGYHTPKGMVSTKGVTKEEMRNFHYNDHQVICHCDGKNQGLIELIADSGMHVAEAENCAPMTRLPIETSCERWCRSGKLTIMGGLIQSMLSPATASLEDLNAYLDYFFKPVAPGNRLILSDALTACGLRQQVKVAVGGAPVNEKFADGIGADGYGADASSSVDLAKKLLRR
jgi:hypothetical protein